MQEVEKTAEILRKVSNFLRTLTDEQIDDLISGRVKLALTGSSRRKISSKRQSLSAPEISGIIEELSVKSTLEDGLAVLDDLALTRESLRQIASTMDLPTPKTDTVAKIKSRIVDATIGYRLRSNAIRASNPAKND